MEVEGTKLEGRTVLITGAGRGIGAAIAKLFAVQGANLMLAEKDEKRLEGILSEIDLKTKATGLCIDVTDPKQVVSLIEKTLKRFGRIDVLVNNVGITRDALVIKMTDEAWKEVLDTCLSSAFYCSRGVAEHFRQQMSGKIVNISSVSYRGNIGQANYSSAKAGLIALTRVLAKELGKFNVNVNAIAPGLIETEGLKSLPAYEMLKKFGSERTFLKRLGKPEEVAQTALFLSSDDAAYISGEVIHVSGGLGE